MGLLTDVEQRIDALFRRVFPRRAGDQVQPLEIAREMAKAMENQRTISVDAVYVPNVFQASVHEEDFAALRPVLNTVKRDAASHLERVAQKRGYSFTGAVRLEIAPEKDVAPGRVAVVARFEEDEKPAPTGPPKEPLPVSDQSSATKLYNAPFPAQGATGPNSVAPSAWLEVIQGPEAGRRLGLKEDRAYLIGRASEADLLLSDNRVSKRHAELRFRDGAWWLTDLDSTNGTRKNGKAVASEALADGDRVTVGLTTLAFSYEREETKIGLDRA